MTRKLLPLIALLWACASARTSPSATPEGGALADAPPEGAFKHSARPTSAEITAADLMTRLYVFADDSMQGREAGTEGNVRGTNYLASEARRIGLRPGGENGTFFQVVPMIKRAADSTSTLAVAGAPLQLNQDYLPLPLYPSFLPYGSQLQADNPASFYAGRVGDSLTAAILAQSAGKLVVFGPALGEDGQPISSLFAKGPPPAVPGAAGVAFATMDIAEKAALEFLGQPQAVVTTTVEDRRRIPLGMLITSAVAESLFGAPLAGLIPGTNGKPLSGQVKFTATPSPAPARNVVAILPGSDPELKAEYVALGAHNDHQGVKPGAEAVDHDSVRLYHAIARPEGENKPPRELSTAQRADIARQMDSLRRIRPPRADSIYNGADDDGSGSVTLLEVAEAFARGPAKPKRSLLFVWHTAEEKGLYGSQWFTDHPTVPRDSIVAQINMDMVGRGRASDTEGGGPATPWGWSARAGSRPSWAI